MAGGRPSGPKTRNGGSWTESKFKSFITNQLRGATRKWAPILNVKRKAQRGRGVYECNECGQHVPPTVRVGTKRVNNVFVDHIEPIVDPLTGFTTYDEYINRMFCEEDNLQLLCGDCHDKKSAEERNIAVNARKENHDDDN